MEQQYLHIESERIHYETVTYSMISTRETIKENYCLSEFWGKGKRDKQAEVRTFSGK